MTTNDYNKGVLSKIFDNYVTKSSPQYKPTESIIPHSHVLDSQYEYTPIFMDGNRATGIIIQPEYFFPKETAIQVQSKAPPPPPPKVQPQPVPVPDNIPVREVIVEKIVEKPVYIDKPVYNNDYAILIQPVYATRKTQPVQVKSQVQPVVAPPPKPVEPVKERVVEKIVEKIVEKPIYVEKQVYPNYVVRQNYGQLNLNETKPVSVSHNEKDIILSIQPDFNLNNPNAFRKY